MPLHGHDAFLVAHTQKSHTSCLPVKKGPDSSITDGQGNDTFTISWQLFSLISRISCQFGEYRVWAASYKEISVLPTNFLHVTTYLEFLLQSNLSYSALETAVYGIRWAHDLFGLSNPCDYNLVNGILKSAKKKPF